MRHETQGRERVPEKECANVGRHSCGVNAGIAGISKQQALNQCMDTRAPEPSREIPAIYNELTEATSCLEEAVSVLLERVAPVIGPIDPRKDCEGRVTQTQLGGALGQIVSRMWALRASVVDTTSAVQL